MANTSISADGPARSGRFPTTHWSVILNAGRGSSPSARAAFGRFYEAYRSPLLAYLRRDGRPETEADDLLHAFMEFLLQHRTLGRYGGQGKFRTWLLACFSHFLSDVWDRERALKRGGAAPHLSLHEESDSASPEPACPARTPVQEYERQFALQFMEEVMTHLREDYQARGKGALYEQLRLCLVDKKTDLSHAELGRQLNLSEASVSQEISRLRRRYRELFDERLLALVGSRDELEEEKACLLAALRSR